MTPPPPGGGPIAKVDTTVPATARIWNYWLGGKDNHAVDRAVGDQVLAASPGIVAGARAQRDAAVQTSAYEVVDRDR